MTEDQIIEALRGRVAAGQPVDYPPYRPTPPVASRVQLDEAEAGLGFDLPALLRRIYLEVANGGVGPFDGIEGLPPDGYQCGGRDMVTNYHEMQWADQWPDGEPPIPPKVLMLCEYGCAMCALLDCRHPDGRMWWWDQGSRYKLDLTLSQWLTAWLTDGSNLLQTAEWLPDESFEGWHTPPRPRKARHS